jgi:TPR repeat protein
MSLEHVVADASVERPNYHLLAADELEKLDEAEALLVRGDRLTDGIGVIIDEEEGWKLIIEAAKRGHSAALASCFDFGRGTAVNKRRAVQLYQEAAKRGHPIGMLVLPQVFFSYFLFSLFLALNNLGISYMYADGICQNYTEAIRVLELAAAQKYVQAYENLGLCYSRGEGVAVDHQRAMELFKISADRNNAKALFLVGCCHEYGKGVETNTKQAMYYYRLAAEMNDKEAQDACGRCLLDASGSDEDEAEAVKWFRRAAENGSVTAKMNLASCYEEGAGVERDANEAIRLYRDAAETGNELAQTKMAMIYEEGELVQQDMKEAWKWARLAAEKDGGAHFVMGNWYEDGRGVDPNPLEALRCYRLAARKKYHTAVIPIAVMYYYGVVVPSDVVMSGVLLRIARLQEMIDDEELREYFAMFGLGKVCAFHFHLTLIETQELREFTRLIVEPNKSKLDSIRDQALLWLSRQELPELELIVCLFFLLASDVEDTRDPIQNDLQRDRRIDFAVAANSDC